MDVSDLKSTSDEVLSDAACDATIIRWVQAVLDFIDLTTMQAGLQGTKDVYADLISRKPTNDGGDTKVADWISAAVGLLDSMSADFA